MKLCSTYLLTLTSTLITSASTSPTPPTLTLNQPDLASNLTTNPLGNPFECWNAALYHSRRASLSDCASAIALLPNLDAHHVFTVGFAPNVDPYTLPRIHTFGHCQVSITMASRDSRDESSWAAINVAALKVVQACAMGYGPNARTGGETTAGTEGRIRVDVEHTR